MNEMGDDIGLVGERPLYMGGENGGDTALLLHKYPELSPPSQPVGPVGTPVGPDGTEKYSSNIKQPRLFKGGVGLVKDAFGEGLYGPDMEEPDQDKFKFYFNYMEFSAIELDDINDETRRAMMGLQGGDSDTDGGVEGSSTGSFFDGWLCLDFEEEDVVLFNHYARGDAWAMLRNRARVLVLKREEEERRGGAKGFKPE